MVKYIKGRNVPLNDLEGGVNVDSDCEGNLIGAGDEGLKEDQNEEIRAILIAGSFSACVCFSRPPLSSANDEFSSWKYLFFYRCTDAISFAPLKSQVVNRRKKRRVVTSAPPPCSPKSIYVLASLVR